MTEISPDLLDRSLTPVPSDVRALLSRSDMAHPAARPLALMVALAVAGATLIALANRINRGTT